MSTPPGMNDNVQKELEDNFDEEELENLMAEHGIAARSYLLGSVLKVDKVARVVAVWYLESSSDEEGSEGEGGGRVSGQASEDGLSLVLVGLATM